MLSINQLEQLPNELIKLVADLIPTYEIRIDLETENRFLIDLFFDTYPDLKTATTNDLYILDEVLRDRIYNFIHRILSDNFIKTNRDKFPPISFLLALQLDEGGPWSLNLFSDIDLYRQLLNNWLNNDIIVVEITDE